MDSIKFYVWTRKHKGIYFGEIQKTESVVCMYLLLKKEGKGVIFLQRGICSFGWIRIKIRIVVNIRVDGFSSIRREGPCFEG